MKFIFKCIFKIIEKFLILRTKLKYFQEKDFTRIILQSRDLELSKKEENRFSKLEKKILITQLLIVIPFKDKWFLTEQCLKSLSVQTLEGLNVHVVLVNNNSLQKETEAWMSKALNTYANSFSSISIENDSRPFNFSAINNRAIHNFKKVKPDLILFLNNDIEFTKSENLKNLVQFYINTDKIGALGCTLVYPSDKEKNDLECPPIIQHLFLAPGIKIVGGHPFKGSALNLFNDWFQMPRIVPAVTGAVFLISYENFIATASFDENLATAYQDLDLCLKLQKLDKINWVLPQTILIHHETATRSQKIDKKEVTYMYNKWGTDLTLNKYFSAKISRWSEKPIEAFLVKEYPWWRVV